jgi:hypothetical protein
VCLLRGVETEEGPRQLWQFGYEGTSLRLAHEAP